MKLRRQVVLPAPFAAVADALQRPALMRAATAPLMQLRSAEPGGYPDRWPGGVHRVTLHLFGILPLGPQIIDVSWPAAPPGEARLRDNGHGPLIKRWDHAITVRDNGDGTSTYIDELDIGAGLLTPLVWLSAQALFIHRQRRLLALAKQGLHTLR